MKRRDVILSGSALGLLACGLFVHARFSRPDPFRGYVGMAAPDEPEQTDLTRPVLVEHPAADLVLFATFSLTALVLSVKAYRDDLSPISPLDLALAWGPSSDPEKIRGMRYSQHDRWYVYRSDDPIPDAVRYSSSNMHMIPADQEVAETLSRAERGSLIRLSGHLCDIHLPDGRDIRSSRSRRDKDGGACEIVFTQAVTFLAS